MSDLTVNTQELADIRNRLFRPVRAIVRNKNNEFLQALNKLREVAKKYDIPMVVIGGMAVIYHGLHQVTTDINVIVDIDQIAKIFAMAPVEGFQPNYSKKHWPRLVYNEVEIGLVPAGSRARKDAPTPIPGPAQLGVSHGLEFVDLPCLMELKLSSHRARDVSDVVELIKLVKSGEIQACGNYLKEVHFQYHQEFVRLCEKAEEELVQERER